MRKNKLLLLLALLLTAATGAWAKTVTWTAQNQLPTLAGKTTATIDGVTITTTSGQITVNSGRATFNGATFSVEDGNITKIVLKSISGVSDYPAGWTISDNTEATWTGSAKSVSCGSSTGVYTIEFTIETVYTASLAEGTKDAANWSIASGEKSAKGDAADGLTGLSEGDQVTLQYTGRLKVKGVKATSDAAAAAKEPATVTTAPTGAAVVGVGKTTALVSGGVAEGGSLMYAVTTTNTKPTSTDGFSGTVPTAQTITASGTVYVWYYVKGDDTHSDSEIAATAIEVPVADIVWDATNISDLMLSGPNEYEKEGVKLSANADQIDAFWSGNGDPTNDGIYFVTHASGGYTFTAPTGKAFTKIEMKASGSGGWSRANLGDGWALNNSTVMWKGSAAASTVGLLTGANRFNGTSILYFAFYLSE